MTDESLNDPDPEAAAAAEGLSEEALELCVGWFARGSKVELNISPPHANLHANRAALDELEARGHVSHVHDAKRDVHTYRGTAATALAKTSRRGRATAMRLLGI
jgi:hypothetical protein